MKVPKYAEGVSLAYLVKFLCKSKCNKPRFGKVSQMPWESAGADLDDPGLYVTCLKCNGDQYDSYNWKRL